MEDKEKDLDNLEKLVEKEEKVTAHDMCLSLIHISEPTRH